MYDRVRQQNLDNYSFTPEDLRLLACVIGRKKRRRKSDILFLGQKLAEMAQRSGNVFRASRRYGLSRSIFNRYLAIQQVNDFIKNAVRKGDISSVDIVYLLSKLPYMQQETTAKYIIQKAIIRDDLRDAIRLWNLNRNENLLDILKQIAAKRNKNIVLDVILKKRLEISREKAIRRLKERLLLYMNEDDLKEVDFDDQCACLRLILTSSGNRLLIKAAKRMHKKRTEFIRWLCKRIGRMP
ncbi:MAG: hypothetical protein QXT63_08870 [Thermoplasmata archaeon]